MSLRDFFHDFLDKEWPLWKEPKNQGGVKYHQLYRAFEAGYKLADEGATGEQLGFGDDAPMLLQKAVTLPPRKFVPPKRRK